MTLHLFEGPVHGPVCYCVPGGAASCATCREKRAHDARTAVHSEPADAPVMFIERTPRVTEWIERFVLAREKALAEGWLKGVDVAEQDDDKTVIWHTSVGPWQRSGPKTATEVREQQRAAEIASRQQGKTDKVLATEFALAVLNDPTMVEHLVKTGASFDVRANAWLKKGEMPGLKRHDAPELDGPCRWAECQGTYEERRREDCSCHINPPCWGCTNTTLECNECGDEPE